MEAEMKRSYIHYCSAALLVATALSAASAWALPIAVIDSGTDLSHPDLAKKVWVNKGEVEDAVDNDRNSYIDDLNGWNFADNDRHLYDASLLGKFSKDVYTYFDVQTRMMFGTATEADRAFYESHKSDQAFIAELGRFGNWVHGTHVAGIASHDFDNAEVMPLKMIGGKTQMMFAEIVAQLRDEYPAEFVSEKDGGVGAWVIQKALGQLAKQQGKAFAPIAAYVAKKGARVANCSFGTSATQIRAILANLLKTVLRRDATEEELDRYSDAFMSAAIESVKKQFIDAAPKTFFVFAAGNEGSNNDLAPSLPAGIQTDHSLTVAATLGVEKRARFSNFGAKTVEVAAPGVGIRSSIPGNDHLLLSGTSQAAPFVSNVVAQVIDANPKLAMKDVKAIVMGTVDQKEFLNQIVSTSGIVNPERAIKAASLSRSMSVAQAISQAKSAGIADLRVDLPKRMNESQTIVVPLAQFL